MTKPEPRQTPAIPEQAYQLYDKYAHGMMSRRAFFAGMSA